jgi:hypothetical protein
MAKCTPASRRGWDRSRGKVARSKGDGVELVRRRSTLTLVLR